MERDQADPLNGVRDEFFVPDGVYLTGHSLGAQPKRVVDLMQHEMNEWARLGVEGHFRSVDPWFTYDSLIRDQMAVLVGADGRDVVAMNTLTVNLHMMLASFYRPDGTRRLILAEKPIFPSDLHALETHVQWHGGDPATDIVYVEPGPGDFHVSEERIMETMRALGDRLALVMVAGVNYATGQRFDLQMLAREAHSVGALFGSVLAHAVGNVPLELAAWDVDFGVWCTYKYLNGGPGSIGAAFVHPRHTETFERIRLGGWWGVDPADRFNLQDSFAPSPGADGWKASNPSVFAIAPLRASLDIFERVGMESLREKSVALTGYLEELLDAMDRVEVVTLGDPERRGCQLTIRIDPAAGSPQDVVARLTDQHVIADFRQPDLIRVAPVPMYNTFHDTWQFAQALNELLD